ncbi:diaminopimelate epimerase [Legionella fairfieldensis]|uniref:diaminopimelate epimerase n=1 Tax=Legionella fairfieldensis TaxID=45064 RepID=UPI00048BC916|nr:diaminopimelate epimerase [Legionella fairfieldensis]
MTIRFTKMHGLGNDFIVIDGLHQQIHFSPSQIKALAQRGTGIGFDQCLLIEASKEPEVDFFYRIFNADGQEVGQCGNGARCLARFIHHYGLSTKKTISVATRTTKMQLTLNDDHTVTVELEHPVFNPSEIPFLVNSLTSLYSLPLKDGSHCEIHALNVGNPHAVLIVKDLATVPVTTLGRQISEHPLFPEQTNVGFMQLIDANHIRLRVYERGCGETNACGSGAVAAAAAGRLFHHLAARIHVGLIGGELIIDWPDTTQSIFLTGPASFVYEGILMTGD